jgi:hypothetical protein
MADAVIPRATLALALALASGLAQAVEVMRDPMRMPTASAEAAAPEAPAADARPDLPKDLLTPHSIRRPAGGAPRVLFGDTWVGVGGRIDRWRVRAIDADAVTLRSIDDPAETRRVLLHQIEIRRTPASR